MALRGNLKDFSLPDVFQLVTFSRKSGVLRIKRADGAEGSVWFRDGDVFFAQSNWHTELLGERLVRTQRITSQALERALALREQEGDEGRRLGEILVSEGYITDKVLEAFVSDQILETIFDLMRWDDGEFDFEATPQIADEDIGLSVSIENVVMEGSRRLEEWTRIRKKIPSMDVVFKMATAPGEGTFEISLKPMEWSLLLLVDGTRSVAELAYATNRTDFEVARIMYGLFSAGLLEFASDEEIEKLRAEREARETKLDQMEAERRALADAAAAETQERESALEAAAQLRALETSVAVTVPEPPAATVPTELPEFLSGGIGPTAEDAAALQEMMGAVLSANSAPPAPIAELQPEPIAPAVPQPELEPEPEPAYVEPEPVFEYPAAIPAIEVEIPVVSEQPIAELSVDDTMARIQASLAGLTDIAEPPAATVEVQPAPLPDLEPRAPLPDEDLAAASPELEPQVPVQDIEPQAPTSAEGFERQLMAMGLGELPIELATVQDETPAAPADAALDWPSVADSVGWVEEPTEPLGVVSPEAAIVPAEEYSGLTGPFEPGPEPVSDADLSESLMEDTPDFSELLSSLDREIAAQGESVYQAMPESSFDFDQELLREVSPEVETGGVISTDAYLEDISTGDDMGFSGGLTAELSALTGLSRPNRPTASVNKLPEPAPVGDVLRRDTRVDRDTLLKIIDGVKNL